MRSPLERLSRCTQMMLVVVALTAAVAPASEIVLTRFATDIASAPMGTAWNVAFELGGTTTFGCGPIYYAVEVDADRITISGGDIPILCVPHGPTFEFVTQPVELQAGSYTAVFEAYGEEWGRLDFSVGSEEGLIIETVPSPAPETDPFRLRVSGIWPDGCVPVAGDVSVGDGEILVRALGATCDAACTLAIENYAFETELIGPLDQGVWDVEYRVVSCGGEQIVGVRQIEVAPALGLPGCQPLGNVLCLDGASPGDRRFSAEVEFATSGNGGTVGVGQVVDALPTSAISGGLFWFFDPRNPEMLVKVLDGCSINGHFWVFVAATTDVGFELTITDEVASAVWTADNVDGLVARPVIDVEAFPCV